MPVRTMASAACLIRSSLTSQANLFQLFQPMGGVRASPLSSANISGAVKLSKIASFLIIAVSSSLPFAHIYRSPLPASSRREQYLYPAPLLAQTPTHRLQSASIDRFARPAPTEPG